MIFDESLLEVLDQAEVLNRMLMDSESYHDYKKYSILMQEDIEVTLLKAEFLKYKERYDEVMRFGRYHPDYTEVMLKTRRAKKAYDMHPLVAQQKQSETALQGLLDDILVTVTHHISDDIKVERGNPFYETCSSGCSCH